ncbi:nucleotidyltransferase domain-containing protein [Synechococcus sp. BDU 130192]|uniref:nucleotidyltransferase domain-containing protein n=1 Tax=Synechococcus sp. BDU 130192 TaxID=2042059 RepID=UPI000C077E6E|nr:nucleotidyltransferase domain-containing protein [Synechococcus sp. BDU 130192]
MVHPALSAILERLRDSLKRIYGPELKDLILFGSQAKNTAKEDSDIDIAIILKHNFDLDQELEKTSAIIADICLEYDILINRIFMDNEYFEKHRSALIRNIQREGTYL